MTREHANAAAEGWLSLRDRLQACLAAWHSSWPALVATADDDLVGCVRALTDGAISMYVADLLVAPSWRGRGLGTALLQACHLLYPTACIELLALPDAAEFYARQGFRSLAGFRRSA